jgi:adenine-specific DNA-methyltransferase
MAKSPKSPKSKEKKVDALKHERARRVNVPTAELQSLAEQQEELAPREPSHFSRARPLPKGETRGRDPDLDPQIVWNGVRIRLSKDQVEQLQKTGEIEIGDAQLVWRGKDRQDWSDLVVNAPMLYVQEKIHPKAIIDDLKRRTTKAREEQTDAPDMFADFNGLDDPEARAEFYQHGLHWSNRMILGDSLQVMASLAEREALRGKVQCIYFDPPYGIKFNSNWQVSTLSRDVKDGKQADVTREPEQVKAFRDTWKDGIHSYLTYLRDRLTVARELLTESGSIFVQIGDENVHRVRALMDEVFGEENFVSLITFVKTTGQTDNLLASVSDYLLWYARNADKIKYRQQFALKSLGGEGALAYGNVWEGAKSENASEPLHYTTSDLTSQSPGTRYEVEFQGERFYPKGYWKTENTSFPRLLMADRLKRIGASLRYVRFLEDYPVFPANNNWSDTGVAGFAADKIYVVQTSPKVIQRCVLMTTDPGDLVLDPTCGSGTTATVAEQWGRRWITIDTSRVALALARTRLMAARYPYYQLADSPEGRAQEQKITGRIQPDTPTQRDVRQGFVYERAPHITLKSIANNAEIDVIWETWQRILEPLRTRLNAAVGKSFEEWDIPRDADANWFDAVKKIHADWWEARIARQKEIDASIAKAADVELLYDRPYEDKSKVRVAGPFTVESLSPHRVVTSRDDSLGAELAAEQGEFQRGPKSVPEADFGMMVLENLRASGVHQKDKADAIKFASLEPWPGEWVAAEGRYTAEDGRERRSAIFIGPEFGTTTRADLTAAAREASEARFDVLIACAFSYDAHASELNRLGPLPILKARMNPDLHMAGELKTTSKGNLFVVFGEPDIDILSEPDGMIRVKVNGVDVFNPATGEIRAGDRRNPLRRHQGHRLLVHRHGLQRRELLRPPCLLPRRQRSLQVSQDGATRGDRRRCVANALRRHVTALPATRDRPHRGEGDQSLRRRSAEGFWSMTEYAWLQSLFGLHVWLVCEVGIQFV